jgi:hypothetical protein
LLFVRYEEGGGQGRGRAGQGREEEKDGRQEERTEGKALIALCEVEEGGERDEMDKGGTRWTREGGGENRR